VPYTKVYSEKELTSLRSMFELNLKMFLLISTNPKLLLDHHENFAFNCKVFDRLAQDKEIRIDQRQLYQLFEDNLELSLRVLKNFDKYDDGYAKVRSPQQMFHIFFDCFCGTDLFRTVNQNERPHNPNATEREKFQGLYTIQHFLEILIKKSIIMLNDLPQKLDATHFLFDKDVNVHSFILKILRYIFRAIKLKEEPVRHAHPTISFASELVHTLQRHILKLVLVVIKLSITSHYPMDYLYLLKLIFKAVRTDKFQAFFNSQIKEKELKILDYFLQLFKSNIDELKITSTEIVFSMPVELSYLISKYPDYAKDMIQMIAFALTLSPSEIILKALQTLDHIISSASLNRDEILQLLDKTTPELFHNLNNLIFSFKRKSYFLKMNSVLEVSAIPFSFKIIARFATFMRNLNIPVNFRCSDDYVLELEKREERKDPTEQLFEEVENQLFHLEVREGGRKFHFNTMQTLISIFQTIETLKTKPTIFVYLAISPNLFFTSTLKHQIGLDRLFKFLKNFYNTMMFTKNADIESYYCQDFSADFNAADEESAFFKKPIPDGTLCSPDWRRTFELTSVKPKSQTFLLKKVVEATFQVVYYLKPFYSEPVAETNFQFLRESVASLVKKAIDPATTQPHLKHNLMCVFESVHNCIQHQ